MRTIGRIVLVLLIGLAAGCDLDVYRTKEGIGFIGQNGGYFLCGNETQCFGTTN